MIKAKRNTAGFYLVTLLTLLVLGLTVMVFLVSFSKLHTDLTNSKLAENLIYPLFPLSLFLILGLQLWRDAKTIVMDPDEGWIKFTNLITRQAKIYHFHELDGFAEMYQSSRYRSYLVYYIIKEGRYVAKISSYYYSNLDEVKSGLRKLNFRGQRQFSYANSIRILFNKRIE